MKKDGIPLGLMIQRRYALPHKIPNGMKKAKRAGVTKVFVNLENINLDNLVKGKRQNKITEYRKDAACPGAG